MEYDSDEQDDKVITHSNSKRHADEDAMEQYSHFQEEALHDGFLAHLFRRRLIPMVMADFRVLDCAFGARVLGFFINRPLHVGRLDGIGSLGFLVVL